MIDRRLHKALVGFYAQATASSYSDANGCRLIEDPAFLELMEASVYNACHVEGEDGPDACAVCGRDIRVHIPSSGPGGVSLAQMLKATEDKNPLGDFIEASLETLKFFAAQKPFYDEPECLTALRAALQKAGVA